MRVQTLQKCCSHHVEVRYWYDPHAEVWRADIIYREKRRGSEYASPVIDRVSFPSSGNPGGRDWQRFIAKVRKQVRENIDVFWT
jgi:hypothetical protein